MFELVRRPIVHPALRDPGAGAFVAFEGNVRARSGRHRVVALEYEAFEALALSEGGRILGEAIARFDLLNARCVHRLGRLEVGDAAVWVGVAAPHRREAFEGCEWIIDQLKRRVPIWKREEYADGTSRWIGADTRAEGGTPLTEASFYARHLRLPEIGPEGQRRLNASRVLVVGAGGLGCAAIPYLAAAGVGTLGICDFDRVEANDLHRQVLYQPRDVGKPKAPLAAMAAARANPFIQVREHAVRLNEGNAEHLLREYDVVLDGTDNFSTKFLLNDLAFRIGTPVIQSSVYRFEGHIQIVDPAAGAGCLRCLWPETPPERCIDSCAETGVLGVVPGVLGALQASETILLLLGFRRALGSTVLLLDFLEGTVTRIQRPRNPDCPACGGGGSRPEVDVELSGRDLSTWIGLDLREDPGAGPLPDLGLREWLHRPLSQADQWLQGLDRNRSYLLVCEHGIRSGHFARRLRAAGWPRVFSLAGGIRLALRLSERS